MTLGRGRPRWSFLQEASLISPHSPSHCLLGTYRFGEGVVNGPVGAGLSELKSGRQGKEEVRVLAPGMGVGIEQGQGHPWVCCLFNLTTKPRGQEVTCSWLAGGLRSLRSGGHALPALSLIP